MDYSIKTKKPESMADAFTDALHSKRTEPVKRMVGGRFGYATHRFPIKGGISLWTALAQDMSQTNILLKRLVERRGTPASKVEQVG